MRYFLLARASATPSAASRRPLPFCTTTSTDSGAIGLTASFCPNSNSGSLQASTASSIAPWLATWIEAPAAVMSLAASIETRAIRSFGVTRASSSSEMNFCGSRMLNSMFSPKILRKFVTLVRLPRSFVCRLSSDRKVCWRASREYVESVCR